MTVYRKSIYALMLLLCASLLLSLSARADEVRTVEGMMNGLQCAIEGLVCPIDKLDPMIAAERDFVLQTDDTFYLIPNLDRAVKSRYVLDQVRVTGEVSERYNAITAQKFEVKENDTYRTIWTPERERRIWEDLRQPGATRP